jgi:hypothetical protein
MRMTLFQLVFKLRFLVTDGFAWNFQNNKIMVDSKKEREIVSFEVCNVGICIFYVNRLYAYHFYVRHETNNLAIVVTNNWLRILDKFNIGLGCDINMILCLTRIGSVDEALLIQRENSM